MSEKAQKSAARGRRFSLYIITIIVAFSLWVGMIYFSCGMGALLSVLLIPAYILVCIANIVFLILITIKLQPMKLVLTYVVLSLIIFCVLLLFNISLPICFARDVLNLY